MNRGYLYEVSCYDCNNCRYNRTSDNYCKSACYKCNALFPQVMQPNNVFPFTQFPQQIWYNPSQFPYGNFYGSYALPSIMY